MTEKQLESTLDKIEVLQESQKNTKIWFGAVMGVILIMFFFTFASLVDKAPPVFFWIETAITLIFIPCFFMLNRISFSILKLSKGNNPEFKDIIEKMTRDDVDVKTKTVLEKINA